MDSTIVTALFSSFLYLPSTSTLLSSLPALPPFGGRRKRHDHKRGTRITGHIIGRRWRSVSRSVSRRNISTIKFEVEDKLGRGIGWWSGGSDSLLANDCPVTNIDRFRFVCCWRRRLILYNPEARFLLEGFSRWGRRMICRARIKNQKGNFRWWFGLNFLAFRWKYFSWYYLYCCNSNWKVGQKFW